jgi:hypothetical protein
MARRSFRDRFFTPPVARAMTSPLGILLGGFGAAVGFVATGGVLPAVLLGAVAWAGRVAAAIPPRDSSSARIDPFTINEPWRRAVQDALQAQTRFREAVGEARSGPLKERLTEIAGRVDDGVEEAWRVARQGQILVEARRRIDTASAQRELAEVEARAAEPWAKGSALDKTASSLRAQLASAERLDTTIVDARDRLRLTNARLDESVARVAELSVAAHDVAELQGLGDDVDALVTDLEALRLGLEEVQRPSTGTA